MLALLCGAFFMVILDASIVFVALPSIGVELGFSEQGLQWVVSAYALTFGGLLLRESRGALERRSYDPGGAVTITGALVLLVYALVEAPDAGWGPAQTILLFAGSALLLAAFALIESRHPAPLVPLRLLRSRTLVAANLVILVFGTVAFGMPYVLTLYAQQVFGLSAIEFGAGTTVLAVMATCSAIAAQAAVLRLGFRKLAATGMALIGAGSLLLTQVSAGGSYFGDIFLGLLVFGAGIGPAFVTATVAALAGVGERESGLASGLSNTALQIGQALGVALALLLLGPPRRATKAGRSVTAATGV